MGLECVIRSFHYIDRNRSRMYPKFQQILGVSKLVPKLVNESKLFKQKGIVILERNDPSRLFCYMAKLAVVFLRKALPQSPSHVSRHFQILSLLQNVVLEPNSDFGNQMHEIRRKGRLK